MKKEEDTGADVLPRLTLRPLCSWLGLAVDVRSVNEFHIDGAFADPVCCCDASDESVALVVCIKGPVSVAIGAADPAAWTVFGCRQSGPLCRRKGDEVRGVRCEERAGRAAPRVRLSLGVKMDGEVEVFIGSLALGSRLGCSWTIAVVHECVMSFSRRRRRCESM